ncbi:MAG TPA: helix-turn-helix transcriptional regulator, partial [Ramlibacter sp.]|nr:helix-turn-helix transcriptional regulator [Ramlibacter sp.]
MSEFEAVPGPSAGTLLRRAREAAGLHVEALAASLKVPAAKLEALEADRYEELPDAVFARALASSICRTLKIDPRPVLERLPLGGRSKLGDQQPINAPLRQPDFSGSRRGLLDQVSRPVALTVVALLLAAVVLIFLPQRQEAPTTQVEPVMPPGSPAVTAAPAESRVSELLGATSAPLTP